MKAGNIILLNGTSSAGKTSLARALQLQLDEPYLHMGNDQFFGSNRPQSMLHFGDDTEHPAGDAWLAIVKDETFIDLKVGDLALRWLTGMYRAMTAWAETGNHLIGDVVLHNERIWQAAADVFHTVPTYLISVYCPLPIAERYEREREERRLIGGARLFYEGVYQYNAIADLVVDTSLHTPDDCAQQIIRHIQSGTPPSAFHELHKKFTTEVSS